MTFVAFRPMHRWLAAMAVLLSWSALPAAAAEEFPFGLEMMLDVAPMAGSERVPTLEIGPSGQAQLDLWCKRGRGQFAVAGDTIVFVPGALRGDDCPADRAQADDGLVADLAAATNWKRSGDVIIFIGPKPLRFRLNTN
jgi:hypothetical protein